MTQETKNVRRIEVQPPQEKKRESPTLRFTPYAWAKLLFLRDLNDAEVGGFGLTALDDLLLVTDFLLVKQKVSNVSVSLDDASVADLFDSQVEVGRKPEQFARIWIHTHPSNMPRPSTIDEQTFERIFGNCDWALMFIIDREDQTYARIRFNVGPGVQGELPVEIDYSHEFSGSNREDWLAEYRSAVQCEYPFELQRGFALYDNYCGTYAELMADIEQLDPEDKEFILAQLRDDFEEQEVMENA